MSTENLTTGNTNNAVITALIKCVNFAAIKHKDQRRNDEVKTPYINHPVGM